MKRLLIALTLALCLSGCVYQQQGNRFDMAKVDELQAGVSTSQDAIVKLGSPTAQSSYPDGSQLLQWRYVYGTAIGVGGGAGVAILFGPDSKMVRVVHRDQE